MRSFGILFHTRGYYYAVKKGYPELLPIPIVTNVASGVYEITRTMYKRAKQRLLEENLSKNLESKVGSEESVSEQILNI